MKKTTLVVALIGSLLGSAVAVAPAHAETSPSAAPATLVENSTVTVQDYDRRGFAIGGPLILGPETEGLVLGGSSAAISSASKAASGSGGGGSASGCRRVTVNNTESTVLGLTAYIFHTWTDWCWTRSSQVVTVNDKGWYISNVDGQYQWKGIINRDFYYYDYGTNDGHPRSAYRNYFQGQFDNCLLKVGCVGTYYPTNVLRSYYDGTWSWETS